MFVHKRAAAGAVACFRVLIAHRIDFKVPGVAHAGHIVLAVFDSALDLHFRRVHFIIPFQQMFANLILCRFSASIHGTISQKELTEKQNGKTVPFLSVPPPHILVGLGLIHQPISSCSMLVDKRGTEGAITGIRVMVTFRVDLDTLRITQMVPVKFTVIYGAVYLQSRLAHFDSSFRQTFVEVSLREARCCYPAQRNRVKAKDESTDGQRIQIIGI